MHILDSVTGDHWFACYDHVNNSTLFSLCLVVLFHDALRGVNPEYTPIKKSTLFLPSEAEFQLYL